MGQFVRFSISPLGRFEALCALFTVVQRAKETGQLQPESDWAAHLPADIRGNFLWPSPDRIDLGVFCNSLGFKWEFPHLIACIAEGDYSLDSCKQVGPQQAEIQVTPHDYPSGGLDPLIALVEGFGLPVLGVNEIGCYESRDQVFGKDSSGEVADQCAPTDWPRE